MFSHLELTGQTRTHITQLEHLRCALHHDVVSPFLAMRTAAAKEGIDLWPYSAFRDFETQLKIWNDKYSGKKTLYDENGLPLDYFSLTEEQIIRSILRWSALPGASRHHWGTEIDVVDRAATASDYKVKLLPEECQRGGPYYNLHCWLDENLSQYGFFRPYATFQGGVNAEPWHLSYFSLSRQALKGLTLKVLTTAIKDVDILGKKWLMEHIEEIYNSYVLNISPPKKK